MKIVSWNVNGIRAVFRKGALNSLILREKPDVFCVQETKVGYNIDIDGYVSFASYAERAGYSGTAVYVRREISDRLKQIQLNIVSDDTRDNYGNPDAEGRVCAVEFPEFFVVSVYTPNSKDDLSRLKLREKYWDPGFLSKMRELEEIKPVIFCGDFNAAHEEIDIARPEANHFHAGFTDEERKGISNIISAGFIDSFRKLYPSTVKYSWWSYRGGARARNVGWRIDYVFVSPKLKNRLIDAFILGDVTGSDHAPVGIEI